MEGTKGVMEGINDLRNTGMKFFWVFLQKCMKKAKISRVFIIIFIIEKNLIISIVIIIIIIMIIIIIIIIVIITIQKYTGNNNDKDNKISITIYLLNFFKSSKSVNGSN